MTPKAVLLVLVYQAIVDGASAHPTKPTFSWANTKHVVAFGDSYTYVQGTRGYANSTFIGSFTDLGFSAKELLTDKIVQNQTGTAEGGPNWVEYLTGCGLQPGLTSPLTCDIQLWDFAFGGADISTQYTPMHHNWTIPLLNQTSQYLTYADPVLSPHILSKPKSLVIFWIGINDIGDSANYPEVISAYPTFYNTLISTMFSSAVTPVHEAGFNNFLFMNLPPLDSTPGNVLKGPEAARPNKTMINTWNSILSSHADLFAEENQGVEARVFDANGFLNGVIDDAASYGIVNTTGYCASYDQPFVDTDPGQYGCLPLSEYFWFNTGHLTSHVHQILAAVVEKFLSR